MAKKQQSNNSATTAKLKTLAEEHLKFNQSSTLDYSTSSEEILRLNNELSVHQIDLEIQQDELLKSGSELKKSVVKYAEFFDFAPLGYLSLDRDSRILEANLTASSMLGVAHSRLQGVYFKAFVIPEDYAVVDALLKQVFTERVPGSIEVRPVAGKTENSHTQSALSLRTLRIDAAMRDTDYGFRIILSDISEQKQKDNELQRMTRALRAINECNQALIHCTDERELLDTICSIMVKTGGYRMAWVGYAEHDKEKNVRPVAQAGFENGYLQTAIISWADVEHGHGPTGTAIRTGIPSASRNILTDPLFKPWHKNAILRGYASVLSVPLRDGNAVFGAITMYSDHPDAFDTEEFNLLTALAQNLAYGITMLRTRKARELAEEERRQSESRYRSLFQNSHTAMLIIDQQDGTIVDANPAAASFYGWTQEELCRMNIKQIDQLTDQEIQAEMQLASTENRNFFLFRHRLADGSLRDVEVYSGTITIEQTPLLYLALHDITERKHAEFQLIEKHKRFTQALEATHACVWEVVLETNENIWSDETWELYGLERGDNKPSHELWQSSVHPLDRERVFKDVTDAVNRESVIAVEYRINLSDGAVRWLMVRGKPLFDEKGKVNRYLGTSIDITERKQIENMFLEKQQRFTQALEASHAGVWEWDMKTGANIWSDEIWELYGLERGTEKPSHELWRRSIYPDDRIEAVRNVLNAAKNASPMNVEYRVIHLDGTVHWLMGRGMPLFDEKGKVARYIGTNIDITERKEIEIEREKLMKSLEGFQAALAIRHIGWWELDLSDHVVRRSLEHERIFGYESLRPHWTYEIFLDHIIPDDRAMVENQFKNAVEKLADWNIECRIRHTDGEVRWIWAVGGYQFDTSGNAIRMSGIIQDITHRKLLEVEKEGLHERLFQAQKMQVVGQLAGGIAHDFNNMLQVILGHTELALQHHDSSYEDLKAIQKAANHSAELTGQLLGFARRQTVSARIIDLNSSVEEMLPILRRLIGENIMLIWLPNVKEALVKLDPSQIIRILTNVCVNARDAISDTGTITIETNTIHVDNAKINAGNTCLRPGDYITLSITDNGHGIDEQLLPHILEPFFTTKAVGKGSGMGLATDYGSVKQGNGFIGIESEKGKGTRIIIYLPLQRKQTQPIEGVIEEQGLQHGNGTILLVEDQPDILQLCRKMLEHQGFIVLAASSPLKAIERAKKYKAKIDLLVTDVIMPEMNGRDLFNKIAAICPKLHVLYMSGFTADYIGKHLAGDRATNFIEKPFSMTALSQIIQDILKKKPEE